MCVLVLLMCCGCKNENATKKVEQLTQKEVQTEMGKLEQKGDFFKVYDISEYNEDEVTYKYQYYIFDQTGKEIDSGIWKYDSPYELEEISSNILRAQRTGGSNAWYSIYYNLKTAEKSQEFDTPIVEIGDFVGLLEKKADTVYLVVQNMFDESQKEKYELGTEDYIPGAMDVKYENGKIIISEYDLPGKLYKEIDVHNLISKQ